MNLTRIREIVAKWRREFHEESNRHFGTVGERLANVKRLCAEELERALAETSEHETLVPLAKEQVLKVIQVTVRILLGIGLLVLIWRHAHWSVAISLTLIAIRHEFIDIFVYEKLARYSKEKS